MEQTILNKINELNSRGESFAVATIIRTKGSTPRKSGTKMLVTKEGATVGTIGGGCGERGIISEALEALKAGGSRLVELALEEEERGGVGMNCGGTVEVYIDVMNPVPKLLIIGGGHVGAHVAKMGEMLGFSVTVVDPVASEEGFPESIELIKSPIQEAVPKIHIAPNTYIVIATQHKHDEEALKGVVGSEARYIGLVGSKGRVKSIFQTLADEGVPREKLERVHAPIGLDIGAQSPGEIATSIIAEIVKVRNKPGATGKSLSKL